MFPSLISKGNWKFQKDEPDTKHWSGKSLSSNIPFCSGYQCNNIGRIVLPTKTQGIWHCVHLLIHELWYTYMSIQRFITVSILLPILAIPLSYIGWIHDWYNAMLYICNTTCSTYCIHFNAVPPSRKDVLHRAQRWSFLHGRLHLSGH